MKKDKHFKIDNIEIAIGNNTNELQRYQIDLEESMKGSDFVFNHVDGLYYECKKISLNCDGSYIIDSPEWIKKQKSNNKSKKQ